MHIFGCANLQVPFDFPDMPCLQSPFRKFLQKFGLIVFHPSESSSNGSLSADSSGDSGFFESTDEFDNIEGGSPFELDGICEE